MCLKEACAAGRLTDLMDISRSPDLPSFSPGIGFCLSWNNFWFEITLSALLNVFFGRIKLFELLKNTWKISYNWKILNWISRHSIRKLFSYCSRFNLLNKYNFELASKQPDSHATPSHVWFKDLIKILSYNFLYY